MFTDIEGFTGLSERLPPAEVASVLNAYLGAVVPVIQRHGGVVNSFIGDGLFVCFNLPLPCDEPRRRRASPRRSISSAPWRRPVRRPRRAAHPHRPQHRHGDRRHDRHREPPELHAAGRCREHRLARRAAQQAFRHPHPRHREHGAARPAPSTASGWARPTCAATRTTSWSIASGRRSMSEPATPRRPRSPRSAGAIS